MTIIDRETFLKLPPDDVAKLVRAVGPQVCIFPINGTRRWFVLEHGHEIHDDLTQVYIDLAGRRHIEIFEICFAHGIDTLVTPIFGSELLNRGGDYVKSIADGMTRLATHPDFLSFYENHKIRVHFYGDYRRQLAGTPYDYLSDLFDDVSKRTAHNDRYRLFYGVFANDATEAVIGLTVAHYQKTGQPPTRHDLIELYYGEYIEKADIFIGFEKFNIFDYPLLGSGDESLYFTIAPSLYLNGHQLRSILYDHIYLRPVQDPDYAEMPAKEFEFMRNYYQKNQDIIYGVGQIRGGIWYATTQILK